MRKNYRPVVLIILDGLGISPDKAVSTWEMAEHPNFSWLEKNFPFTTLQASGLAVGLPWGEAGNSEVGHLTMGAGRIIYNYLPKISKSIKDGSFFTNETLLRAVSHAKNNNSSLHLVGLFSTGTVHAYFEHLYALLDLAKKNDAQRVYLHLFTDGKDAYKKEAAEFYAQLEDYLKTNHPNAKIASVVGRNFAMDRNENWEKTEKAYDLFVGGAGEEFEAAADHIKNNYQREISDESVEPGFIKGKEGRIKDNDAVIFFNFREDSVRQLTRAFVEDGFAGFKRIKLNNLFFATMTEYDKNLPINPAFKSAEVKNSLAKIISNSKLKQLHIAESEKYAHITYFFNGGTEDPVEGESRILVPSLESGDYGQAPEMSADKISAEIIKNIGQYDFIAANFANADLIGHTGNLEATAKAIEALDRLVGEIAKKILDSGGVALITADHGNAEEKFYLFSGNKKTKHSVNPVPFIVAGKDFQKERPLSDKELEEKQKTTLGTLADIAPTILALLGLEKSPEMTGENLLGKMG